jgi:hypothetical protein
MHLGLFELPNGETRQERHVIRRKERRQEVANHDSSAKRRPSSLETDMGRPLATFGGHVLSMTSGESKILRLPTSMTHMTPSRSISMLCTYWRHLQFPSSWASQLGKGTSGGLKRVPRSRRTRVAGTPRLQRGTVRNICCFHT